MGVVRSLHLYNNIDGWIIGADHISMDAPLWLEIPGKLVSVRRSGITPCTKTITRQNSVRPKILLAK